MHKEERLSLGIVGGGEGALKAISAIKGHKPIDLKAVVCQPDELVGLIAPQVKTTSYESLLNRNDIDAIYIATPNNTHVDLALKAVEAGKHVIAEKPLSHTLKEAQRLLQKKSAKTVVAVAFKKRYGPAVQYFREAVSSAKKSVNASYKWLLPAPKKDWIYDRAKSGGGVIMDLGSHVFDLFEYIFGKIDSIWTREMTGFDSYTEIEDHAIINIEFRSGFKGKIELSWSSKIAHQCLTVEVGSRKLEWQRAKRKWKSVDIFEDTASGIRKNDIPPEDEYRNLLNCFHKKILEGRGEIPDVEAGIRNLRIINAAYQSAREGKEVIIP